MAQEARVALPREDRPVPGLLLERVEDGAELRIDGADLHHRAVLAVADVHVVVEIQGARRLRGDTAALQARLGENEHLRRARYMELVEQPGEIAHALVEDRPELSGVNALLQPANAVVGPGLAVADRLLLELVAAGDGCREEQREDQSCYRSPPVCEHDAPGAKLDTTIRFQCTRFRASVKGRSASRFPRSRSHALVPTLSFPRSRSHALVPTLSFPNSVWERTSWKLRFPKGAANRETEFRDRRSQTQCGNEHGRRRSHFRNRR